MAKKESDKPPVNLDTDFKASADRLKELQAGRPQSDISIHDEYWEALKKHRAAHGQKS